MNRSRQNKPILITTILFFLALSGCGVHVNADIPGSGSDVMSPPAHFAAPSYSHRQRTAYLGVSPAQ